MFRVLIIFTFLLALPWPVFGETDHKASGSTDDDFWKSIYEDHHVLSIEIHLTEEAWNTMQPTRGRGRESNYPYVEADISIDGKPFSKAGLRFKGNSSYRSSSRGYKRPLKIDTNRFVKGQKLHGRTKLNLSNAYLDSAFMKEKLAYDLYRDAGIPVPGVGWAAVTLTIEGVVESEPLGVYVLIEQVDKDYLVRNFGKDAKESLLMKPEISSNWEYPGAEPALYEPFGIKVGEGNKVQIHQFGELLKLIHNGSDEDFAKEIGERLNLQQFAGYLAATSLLANVDSYIGMPHNYYLLMDKTEGKLRLLPWDVNEAFGTFTMGSSPEALTDWDIDRPWLAHLKLVQRLFAMETFSKLYHETVVGLMNAFFTQEKLFAKIAEFEDALLPHLSDEGKAGLVAGTVGDSGGYNTAVGRRVFAIKPFITRRIASVKAQLAGKSDGTPIEMRRRGGPGRGRRGGPPRGGQPRR